MDRDRDIDYGFAKHLRDALPNASFIGFTGTPIESADQNTPAVFGDYIDIYDIQRAVEDGATVRIYYEGRLARIDLKEAEKPKLDEEFEEVTEGEEQEVKEKAKTQVGAAGGAGRQPTSGSPWSPRTSSSTSSGGWRRWTARR